MSEFNLAEALAGLEAEEISEFLSATLTKKAVAEFKARKQGTSLKAQYDEEIKQLDRLPYSPAKVKRIYQVKDKYRSQGLEVY